MASLNDIETKVQYIIGLLDARTTKTITGVLPLTFTTTEDKLRDWEIRGNDDVGENLFDGEFVQGYYSTSSGTLTGSTRYIASSKFQVIAGQTYTISFTCAKQGTTGGGAYGDGFVSFWNGSTYLSYVQPTKTGGQTFTAPENATLCALNVGAGGTGGTLVVTDISEVMLVRGSTAPSTYIPYQQGVGQRTENGYIIPLSINGDTVNLPIGNSPLTAGQSISKTSTGVDIATTEGENTISTTLYNKPEMTIKYK